MNVNSEILAALSASSHLASTQQPDDKQISIHLNENHQEEKGRSLLFARSGTTPIDSLTLRILIANDIRHDIRNILKVAQQIGEKNVANERPIQLILLTGNLANMNTCTDIETQDSKFKNTSLAQTSNAEGEVMSVVARFEQIKRRVYYIPGSTDPQSLYSRNNKRQKNNSNSNNKNIPPHLTLRSVNVHNWWVEIQEGIVLVGFSDACNDDDTENSSEDNGEDDCGDGTSCENQTFNNGCSRVVSNAIEWWKQQQQHLCVNDSEQKKEDNQDVSTAIEPQIILMTHSNGNGLSASALSSQTKTNLNQKSILLNVHGKDIDDDDSSRCTSQDVHGCIPIIHSGSITKGGDYAIVDLKRTSVGEKWMMDKISFENVNNLPSKK